jgi:hypothetical protein
MGYIHQKEANKVADNIEAMLGMLTDTTPDSQQIAQLIADSIAVISGVVGPLSAEQKAAYKSKFLVKVALAVGNRELDRLLPDSESKP